MMTPCHSILFIIVFLVWVTLFEQGWVTSRECRRDLGVEDYPRTIQEFEIRFSTEERCRAYLVSLRWPDGFRCPHCQGSKAVMVRDRKSTRLNSSHW